MDDALPRSIGNVAARALGLHGITTLTALAAASERELLDIHGVGPKAIRILRDHLAERGLRFRE
jgi:predicted flap endonuclease-1-like 5' DNA nuclease